MSFPTSPTDGQIAQFDGITYQYTASTNSWKRIPSINLNLVGNISTTSNVDNLGAFGSGALQITGGAAIGGNLFVGGNLYVSNVITQQETIINSDVIEGNLTVGNIITNFITGGDFDGNVYVTGYLIPTEDVVYDLGTPDQRWRTLYLSGNTIDMSGAQITATSSGITFTSPDFTKQFTIIGNAGGYQQTGLFGNIIANAGVTSTSTTTGTIVVEGGMGITQDVVIGGNLEVYGQSITIPDVNTGNVFVTTGIDSTSTGSGAVQVIGGIGVTGNIFAGNLYAQNTMVDRGPDQNNWDQLTEMGIYLVNRSSWSGVVGAPLDSSVYTGLLEVTNTGGYAIVQNYRPYDLSGIPHIFWTRIQYNNAGWANWTEIVNAVGGSGLDGGSF